MARLSVTILPQKEWQEILSEFGNGNITPHYRYEELDSEDDRFKWHMVVHAHNTQSDDLTSTGFLRTNTGNIVAGVDGNSSLLSVYLQHPT